MKIVCVLGSPRRNGNSSTLAQAVCEQIGSPGSNVQTVYLNGLGYKGCQACMVCKTKLDRCVLVDDLTEVLAAVAEADVLILATPVYFGDVPSQMKGFIDRMYSYLVPDYRTNQEKSRLRAGKKLVFIQVQGRPDESKFADVFPRYEEFFDWYGFTERHLVRGWGLREPGEVKGREDVMTQAREVARRIV
jgi:multimeric flavodoxin WrbA